MKASPFPLREHTGYRYLDEGPTTDVPPVVLLHGMLGGVENWTETIHALRGAHYRVLAPLLPVYELPMQQSNVQGLVDHVEGFLDTLGLAPVVLVGNSLGGQVALIETLQHPARVCALVLSGSSGIYEVETGTETLRRRDREFIRQRAALTFYDPAHVTDQLVEDAYALVNDRGAALRLIRMARSAQKETITEQLARIPVPTQLIWGHDDRITPPDVAEQFRDGIPDAELHYVPECGHAPMIEHPQDFNRLLLGFLRKILGSPAPAPSANGLQ